MLRQLFISHFNCTIQELKLSLIVLVEGDGFVFQLHHTGIKTSALPFTRIYR